MKSLPCLATALSLSLWMASTTAAEAPRWILGRAEAPAAQVELAREDAAGLELVVRLNWVEAGETAAGLALRLPGEGLAGAPGDPGLPSLSRLLAAPGDAAADLEILTVESERRAGLALAPQPAPGSDRPGAGPTVQPAPRIPAGQVWPARWAELGESALWQGRRVQPLDIFPLRMETATGELELLRSLTLRVTWRRGQLPAPAPRAGCPQAAELVRGRLLNPDSPWAADPSRESVGELPGRYLVLAPDAAAGGLEEWILWRRQQGYDIRLLLESQIGGQNPTAAQIKTAIQDQFDDAPFDYLLLVGDVDRYPSGPELDYNLNADFIPGGQYSDPEWSGRCNSQYCIVTDHPFAQLEGTDYFADVLVGRFSVDTENDLRKMVHRTVEYDAHPYTGMGSQWFKSALMIYEVTGGMSRRETKLAIRDLLTQELGYTRVDTILNRYWDAPVPPAVVTQRVNAGVSLVNYRGYGFRYQWFGPLFGVDQISDLTNVGRWPLVTSIVCGGGDFASVGDDPSFGEAWLRAGATPSEPTGAVAFIGPSEEDTHTEWNNAIDEGIYEGLAREGLRSVAALMDRGKLELWQVYPNARGWGQTGRNVPFYFHAYNLQGDPGLELRVEAPRSLVVDAPDSLALGAAQVEVQAAAQDGLPVGELRGCLYHAESDAALCARADASGRLVFDARDLPQGLAAGEWTLTLYGPGLLPWQGPLQAGLPASRLDLQSWSLVGEAPGDTLPRPGAILTLRAQLAEGGAAGFAQPRALLLSAPQGGATILGEGIVIPSTQPGQVLEVEEGLGFQLADSLVFGEPVPLELRLDGALLARLELQPALSAFQVQQAESPDSLLAPGHTSTLRVHLQALGLPAGPLEVRLGALHNGVAVLQGEAAPLELAPDSSAWLEGFQVAVDAAALSGSLATFELGVWAQEQPGQPLLALLHFQLPLGAAAITDPLGPDEAGYLAWHSGDEGPQAPVPQWDSIADTGTLHVVYDWLDSWGMNPDGVSLVLDLPFPFQYYGQSYDQATVCTNGWLAFGAQPHIYTGINTPIPAAQGPSAMIAAYWTDLVNSTNGSSAYGHLYSQAVPEQGLFIVEWNHFRTAGSNAYVDVQLILRDPAQWPTATGDGEILLQLHDVTNSNGDNGVTVGLEAPDEQSGLQYAFNNQWAPAAQPLSDGCAILFTPMEDQNALDEAPRPAGLRLGVHPNPFNPTTRLSLELAQPARARWRLCNLLGQTVREADWRALPAGLTQSTLDGAALASGVYLLTVEWQGAAGGGQRTEKLLLLR